MLGKIGAFPNILDHSQVHSQVVLINIRMILSYDMSCAYSCWPTVTLSLHSHLICWYVLSAHEHLPLLWSEPHASPHYLHVHTSLVRTGTRNQDLLEAYVASNWHVNWVNYGPTLNAAVTIKTWIANMYLCYAVLWRPKIFFTSM